MKVSVLMITYNHEKFIAQAIESILMQETDFDYELVIGEDCSTDSTRRIVQQFAQQSDKVKALLPEKNLGMINNLKATLSACQGEYVAICEGDDYWTDPLKLQKQVDFLEANSDFSLCFHNVIVHHEGNESKNHVFNHLNQDVFYAEIFQERDCRSH